MFINHPQHEDGVTYRVANSLFMAIFLCSLFGLVGSALLVLGSMPLGLVLDWAT